MKPCHSPYCECTRDQRTHPGFYDARHLTFEFPKSMPIKSTHQAAYDFAMATIRQSAGESMLDQALRTLGSDNQIIDLCEPILVAYRKLLTQTLGEPLMDWLDWWMYECDHGTKDMEFVIDGTHYSPVNMTLYKFLEIVDAS